MTHSFSDIGLFEVMAADESQDRRINRKALVLAETRLDKSLGKFLASAKSRDEFDVRFSLVNDEFSDIVKLACDEIGVPSKNIESTLHSHYRNSSFTKGSPDPGDDSYFGGKPGSAKKAYESMIDQYGKEKGEEVYYATRNKHKGKSADSSVHEGEEKWIQKAVKKPGDLHKKLHVPEDEKIPESKIEEAEESGSENLKEKAQFAENVKGLGKGKKSSGGSWICSQCQNDKHSSCGAGDCTCAKCHQTAEKHAKTHFKQAGKLSAQELNDQIQKLARRPKMCPYHSEVTDIALATGDPKSGYETMQQHAWGDNHCQGGWDGGKCKFKTQMVNQSYWDQRDQELNERREERAQQGLDNVTDLPVEDNQGDIAETNDHIDLENPEVVDFPSSDGGGSEAPASDVPLAVTASSVHTAAACANCGTPLPYAGPQGNQYCPNCHAEHDPLGRPTGTPTPQALNPPRQGEPLSPFDMPARAAAKGADDKDTSDKEKVDLPTNKGKGDNNSDLDGPSPKIDKDPARKKGDQGWSLKEIDVPSKRNPTERKDITKPIEKKNITDSVKSDVKEIGEQTTETQDLPSTDNFDDAGFAKPNQEQAPHTNTWGDKGQTDPVTNQALSSMRWATIVESEDFDRSQWECPQCGEYNVATPYCRNCGSTRPRGEIMGPGNPGPRPSGPPPGAIPDFGR